MWLKYFIYDNNRGERSTTKVRLLTVHRSITIMFRPFFYSCFLYIFITSIPFLFVKVPPSYLGPTLSYQYKVNLIFLLLFEVVDIYQVTFRLNVIVLVIVQLRA